MKPKERYERNFFQIKTKKTGSFHNTYDSLTPFVSAFIVGAGFEGSVVSEVNNNCACGCGYILPKVYLRLSVVKSYIHQTI